MNLYAEQGRLERQKRMGKMPPPPKRPRPDTTGIKRQFHEVRYSDASAVNLMSIFLPEEGDGPFPVIFFIHGGAFRVGDRLDGQVEPFLDGIHHGYAVATIDYRLSGEVVFPQSLLDCKAALRYLKAHAPEYQIDPERIALAGDSSGGNLALMVAVTGGVPELDVPPPEAGKQDSGVRCGVIWFAPTDLGKLDEMYRNRNLPEYATHDAPHSPESDYLGITLGELDAELQEKASPLTYLSKTVPPMLVQHGKEDRVVPYEQSVLLAEAVKARCGADRITLELLEEADHEDPKFKTPENMARVFRYLDEHLK